MRPWNQAIFGYLSIYVSSSLDSLCSASINLGWKNFYLEFWSLKSAWVLRFHFSSMSWHEKIKLGEFLFLLICGDLEKLHMFPRVAHTSCTQLVLDECSNTYTRLKTVEWWINRSNTKKCFFQKRIKNSEVNIRTAWVWCYHMTVDSYMLRSNIRLGLEYMSKYFGFIFMHTSVT